MPQPIHISTARKILSAPEPVDLEFWTAKGEIQKFHGCVSLKQNHYAGTRNIKILASGQIRRVRDCCIFRINGCEVFL